MVKSPDHDHTLPKGPIHWMAGHSVAANLLMAVLLIGGLIFSFQIKKEVFPDFDMDMVTITVPYPGASPEEVERGILLAIEEAVRGLEGIKKVSSTAHEGSGTVVVELYEGENTQRAYQEIQAEVDRILSFPDDAEDPTVTIAAHKHGVVSLALYGDQDERTLRVYAEYVRDRLLQNDAITQVDLESVRDYEISVEIPLRTLRHYNLTLAEVAQRISTASVDIPGGAIKAPSGDVLLRMKEQRNVGEEFGHIPIITTGDGSQVLLEDLAVIKDGFVETEYQTTFNGQPAIMIEVYRVGEQTPIEVSDAVRATVAEIEQTLPPGLGIDLRNDRSDVYRQRMNLLLKNGAMGLVLVFFLLALFLEPRLAFWVSLGIPISFLGSLYLLPVGDVSINMISMFAFIVTLGIVVDDAIVVGENIYSESQKGQSWFRAAVIGAREISVPVTFSVLTNMVAFLPMFFVPGFMGKIFRQIPVVVCAVFALSLVESLFILPSHLGHHKHRQTPKLFRRVIHSQQRFSNAFIKFIKTKYGPFLAFVLRWRYVSLGIGIAVLIFSIGYIKSGRLGFEQFPKIESDYSIVTATLPFGTAFDKTAAVEQRLVQAAKTVVAEYGGDQLSDGTFARIWGNVAEIRVYLTAPEVRPISTSEFTDHWRKQVGSIPGLESLRFESDAGGPGRGFALSIELSHQDVAVLEKASAELASAMAYYPNVVDVDDGYSPGKRQIDFQVRPEALSLGLSASEIARQLRNAYYGAEALRQQRGRNEVRVTVRLPKSERSSEYYLEQMILQTPAGGEMPLKDALVLKRGRAYTDINRREGRRIVTVSADVRPRSKADLVLKDATENILPELQSKYAGLKYSFEGHQADQRESMDALLKGELAILLVIFAMLAIPLNSYIQPIIIMTAIPFGIIGAVFGHLLMGYSLSLVSVFGLVALTGVVINDSLVLIDMANRNRRNGMDAYLSILLAGQMRFRPIMLTTLTTFGGLAPMIFETSRQARFLIPMAISLGFGVVFATLITLALVPSIYLVLEDFQWVLRKFWKYLFPGPSPQSGTTHPATQTADTQAASRDTH